MLQQCSSFLTRILSLPFCLSSAVNSTTRLDLPTSQKQMFYEHPLSQCRSYLHPQTLMIFHAHNSQHTTLSSHDIPWTSAQNAFYSNMTAVVTSAWIFILLGIEWESAVDSGGRGLVLAEWSHRIRSVWTLDRLLRLARCWSLLPRF